jgi:hypothetical protein
MSPDEVAALMRELDARIGAGAAAIVVMRVASTDEGGAEVRVFHLMDDRADVAECCSLLVDAALDFQARMAAGDIEVQAMPRDH